MAQLYPPIIEGTIAAAADDGTNAILTVPFLMNKAVSWNDISGFVLQVKSTGLDNKILGTVYIEEITDDIKNNLKLGFDLKSLGLSIGQFYKAQLAYYIKKEDKKDVGYYSTVGIFKYTSMPKISVKIKDLEHLEEGGCINPFTKIIALYENEDVHEKIYSYRFRFYKTGSEKKELLLDSGEILYNSIKNEQITWSSNKIFSSQTYFDIYCTITTINNLVCESTPYACCSCGHNQEDKKKLVVNIDNENCIANIELKEIEVLDELQDGENQGYIFSKILGIEKLEDNFKERKILQLNNLNDYKDYSLEFNKTYQYILYIEYKNPFANDLLANLLIKSEWIKTSSEHSYLFNGERQLKIKYNPKISSFKTTQLEQKTNTMGGKFPFFYTNGNVNYKEFPISGLLSYLSDEEGLFDPKYATINLINRDKTQSKSNNWNNNVGSTQLTPENIELERQFKMEVLDFLTSGKPMLFRSPTEGNYIVRLSNVSLSPNDTLGRMLHTFSATATECAEYNEENLRELGLVIKEV